MCNVIDEFERFKKNKRIEEVLSKEFNTLGWGLMKEYIKYESNNTCSSCGLSEWCGVEIPLEINHIDGDNTNNDKDNLEPLCPNCHALTDTWKGRNNRYKKLKKQISDSELLKLLLKNDWNIRKSLIECGYTPKGGNYKRCNRIKREYQEFGDVVGDINKIKKPNKEILLESFKRCDSVKDMVVEWGVTRGTINKWLLEYNLKYDRKSKIPTKDELIDKFKEFKSFVGVGRYYGVSDNGVKNWCVKYDILTDVRNINKIPKLSKDDLVKSFTDLKSMKLVCDKYGVSDSVVRKWCEYYGVLEYVRSIYN